MARQRYRRPPVVEALCEVYFAGSQWDDAVPGRFYDVVRGEFPKRQQMAVLETEMKVAASGEISTSVRPTRPRIRFLSDSEKQIVQVGEGVLVVNQLPPYPSFDEWAPVVERMIGHYGEIARPATATQVAVRYINRISFAEQQVRMEDWFAVYPEVPDSLGRAHGVFMLRLELPARQPDDHVLVTFGSAPPEPPATVAHLLDIYVRARIPEGIGLGAVMPVVRRAQVEAERIFEATITDQLRERFQPETTT